MAEDGQNGIMFIELFEQKETGNHPQHGPCRILKLKKHVMKTIEDKDKQESRKNWWHVAQTICSKGTAHFMFCQVQEMFKTKGKQV
jgi:hypothetical protein